MSVRVRFAPSPTGHVHIGNIRVAIFNWLFARHQGGAFLLRIEDTDRERSTPEAIETLLEAMQWLGLRPDEEPLYQSSQCDVHRAAAQRLLDQGDAYTSAKGGGAEAILFRIPYDAEKVPGVTVVGPATLTCHPDMPVVVSRTGVSWAGVSRKGKPMSSAACLAGFRDLVLVDADGNELWRLDSCLDAVLAGDKETVEGAAEMRFTRRQVGFSDLVKGDLAKPLDSLKDFVIVRSDGTPVFHLANVCDDITQATTHIIRGDDHVENGYRHTFLFAALGATPPRYASLPMIVNKQGKPYSKRDGDAFVGDFRDRGHLAAALFNYLTLLGWAPGDDREKMTRDDLVAAFTLDRVQQSSARMDARKLLNINGKYIAELPPETFLSECLARVRRHGWGARVTPEDLRPVAELLQSRTRLFTDVAGWRHFFEAVPEYDAKAVRKVLGKPGVGNALQQARAALADEVDFSDLAALEAAVAAVAAAAGLAPGKLNQPLRVAVTGQSVGAGIFETLAVLGRETALRRIDHAITLCRNNPEGRQGAAPNGPASS